MPRRALLLPVLMPGCPCIDISIDVHIVARDAARRLGAPGLAAHGSGAFLVSVVPTTGGCR